MLNYNTHVKGNSAYNTPPVFAVYILGLVAKWLKAQGGLDAMARLNQDKAETLYRVIDASRILLRTRVAGPPFQDERDLSPTGPEAEELFVTEAAAEGLAELKGYRSVGGIRASIYNAFPVEGVQALASLHERVRAHSRLIFTRGG